MEKGTYMVTAGTYLKVHRINEPRKLDLVRDTLFELAEHYGWLLQAWSILINHYHFVGMSPRNPENLHQFLSHFHQQTAKAINRIDGCPGRRVWYQYFETLITHEESYLARLRYVHENPVHHGLVIRATDYPWCSAAWFERKADRAFFKTVNRMKIDRLNVFDEF
jgi:putative transposase